MSPIWRVHCHIVVSARPSRRSGTRRWNLSGLPGSRMEGRGGGACNGRRVACATTSAMNKLSPKYKSLYYDVIGEWWFLAQAAV